MNKKVQLLLILCISFISGTTYSQDLRRFEFGLGTQFVQAIGDEANDGFSPKASYNFLMRVNFPYRLALRVSLAPNFIYNEKRSGGVGWDVFKSSKAIIGGEYHFQDYNAFDARKQTASYLMAGLSYNIGSYTAVRPNWNFQEQLGYVAGIGVKHRLRPQLLLSFELAYGYLGSDDYDRLEYAEGDFRKTLPSYEERIGNDGYFFSNLSITYTFAQKFRFKL
jgi:hypothetical protein